MAMPQAKNFDGGLHGRSSSVAHGESHPLDANEPASHPARTSSRYARSSPVERVLDDFMQALLRGDRPAGHRMLREQAEAGVTAEQLLEDLVWPACSTLDGWSRRDQISAVHLHCATLLLRQLSHALGEALPHRPSRGRTILVTSGPKPLEELAAEVFVDLAEADGFDVVFLGGGVESDDAFEEIGKRLPDFVISYAAAGTDAARLRRLLHALETQRPVPGLRVGVGGGVFSRAPGLADELGIDLQGDSPFDLLAALRTVAGAARRPGSARAA
jgi:MerR family transcriptional regulator, light-induced transcriptional regulator